MSVRPGRQARAKSTAPKVALLIETFNAYACGILGLTIEIWAAPLAVMLTNNYLIIRHQNSAPTLAF